MVHDDDLPGLRNEAMRERFALEREERRLEAGERELEDGLEVLDEHEARAEVRIEAELRREHWGRPERPPAWRRPRPG